MGPCIACTSVQDVHVLIHVHLMHLMQLPMDMRVHLCEQLCVQPHAHEGERGQVRT